MLDEVVVNEMGDNFRVGLGFELVTQFFQPVALLFVIFDNAVVHHAHQAARDVRMGIGFGNTAVRGPTRVADSHEPVEILGLRGGFHFRHTAHAAHALDGAVEHRHAGRVVTAILQALQAFDKNGYDVTLGYGAYDSAHDLIALKRIR